MHALQVSLFGTPVILSAGRDITHLFSSRAIDLLAYLLLGHDRPHPREKLAETLWPEQPGAHSRKALRQALWSLRRIIAELLPGGSDFLTADSETIQINMTAGLWIDIAIFEAACNETRGIPGPHLSADMALRLHQAADLYTGDLLEGSYKEWCVYERERFHVMLITILDKLTDRALARHDAETAIEFGHRMLRFDRARERTYRQLMLASHLAGDRVGAIRHYERCVRALREELDVEPLASTVALYNRVRAGDASVGLGDEFGAAPAASEPRPENFQLQVTLSQLASIQQRIKHIEAELLEEIEALRGILRA